MYVTSEKTNSKYKCYYRVFVAGITTHSVAELPGRHSGKATAGSHGNTERRSDTVTWSLDDAFLRAVLSRLFSTGA